MNGQSITSNVVARSNVYRRQLGQSLHADMAYVQRVRGGHNIRLVAKAIAMASHDYQITALVEQSTFFTPLQRRDYADRFIRQAGTVPYGWDLDADGRIVWKHLYSCGSRLLKAMATNGTTATTTDNCWFVAADGRIHWGTLPGNCSPLLKNQAES